MAGERMDVTPPSTSFSPAEAPARRAVTRSLVPLALRGQPRSVSKLSKKTVVAPGGVTVIDIAELCESEPITPLTWKLVVPVAAEPDTDTVSVLLTLPPDGGVTGLPTKPQVTPLGRPVHDRVTALLKPFTEVTVQVLVALPPWAADRLDGLQETVKSGVTEAVGSTVSQLLARPEQAFDAPAATTL